MTGSSLLGGPRITAEQVRGMQFPMAMLGGYRTTDVEAFRRRVADELRMAHAALADFMTERQELLGEIERLGSQPHPAVANGRHAIDVLAVAQGQADRLVSDARAEAQRLVEAARAEAGQLTEHARQQAGRLVESATAEGEAEKARIIDSATAEARKQVDFLSGLAKTMREGLGGQVETLMEKLSAWEEQAHSGAVAA
jgi:DivIVA domain-containing protein